MGEPETRPERGRHVIRRSETEALKEERHFFLSTSTAARLVENVPLCGWERRDERG